VIGPEPAPSPRPSRPPAPELIGSVLAVIVAAVIVGTALASRAAPGPEPSGNGHPTTSASALESFATETPSPPVDPKVVELIRKVNQDLAAYGESLKGELGRPTFRAEEVAALIRQVNFTAGLGNGAISDLGGALGPEEVGGRLAAMYLAIINEANNTLKASIRFEAAYKIGASRITKYVDNLADLQKELDALAVSTPSPPPSPSASPSVSVAPSPSPPSPSPPPSVAPPSSGPPSSAPSGSASASPVVDEQIINGGFEAGVGPPWQLLARPGINATLTKDTVAPGAGAASARVDITSPSVAYSAISLQQVNLHIEAGRYYTMSLMVRSASPRDIRIGISSTDGEASYFSREAVATPAWAPISFTFAAPATDLDAVLAFDLGRSAVTTWFDAVSFHTTPIGP
jgi:Carbohydrate binding domain